MIYWIKRYCYLILIIFVACKSQPKVEVVPVETFFTAVHQKNYRISPNGKFLAFLQTYRGKLNVFIRSVTDTTTIQITAFTDISVRSCDWAGNNKLICVKEKDSLNSYAAFLLDKNGGKPIIIQNKPNTRVNILDNTVHQNSILVTINDRSESFFDVYKVDVSNGEKHIFVKNPGNFISWFADNKGNVNLAIGGDGVNETVYFRKNADQVFRPIISNNFKNSLTPVAFTESQGGIYALSNLNRDKLALVKFDCSTGKELSVIYENSEVDIYDVFNSGLTGKPVAVAYELERRQMHFLDPGREKIYHSIANKLPGQEIQVTDKDSLERNFLVKAYTDKNPGAYYIYNVHQRKLKKLSEINPQINPENMCEMRAINYKTRDGVEIQGYLTLPLGHKKANFPCVVFPHKGPSTRDVWGYTPEVQFFANRGYAVLQMNFRGSTGYGKDFRNAGFKQWGTKMQDDIFDGVKWLIDQGIANPKKIGVFGYGFGGYSALNQLIRHPNTYKCGASYSGYINLFTYIKGFPAYFKPYKLMLNEIIGDPEKDIEYLKHSSPIFQVEQIKKPIFIAQGGKDSKVNVTETNQFVKELRKKNIAVNYILNENETQLFKDNEHKLELYKQLCGFLDQHLKN